MEIERLSLSQVCIVLVFLCTNMIQSLTQVNNMETIINLASFVVAGLFLTEEKRKRKKKDRQFATVTFLTNEELQTAHKNNF